MNAKRYNSLRLLAIALTLMCLLGQNYLPPRRELIHPHPSNYYFVYADRTWGGKSTAGWINEDVFHWRCTMTPDDTLPVCGLAIAFPGEPDEIRRFADFESINIKLRYQGGAKKIRVYVRNFNPAYAKRTDPSSHKFNSATLQTSEYETEVNIKFSEFRVADWWIEELDVPRELAQPEFDQIIALGIDLPQPYVYGDHDVTVEKIELIGSWVSNEKLYFGIILAWMVILFWEGVGRLAQLYRKAKQDEKRLRELAHYHQELKAESDKYRELSTTDTLTGILNRRGLLPYINELEQNPVPHYTSLMVLDVDHFKRINDRRGHDTGDKLLKGLSATIRQRIRSIDIFARWGGEEFVLINPQTNRDSAVILAEKIRKLIADTTFEPANPINVTISIGVAILLEGETFEQLFQRADQALYQAKQQGRNCVQVA